MREKRDTRYRFVRARNVFLGLEDYKESPFLKMKKTSLEYKLNNEDKNDIANKIGDYFESLIQGIYGGNLKQTYIDDETGMQIEVDLLSGDHKGIRESKTTLAGKVLKIRDIQLAKYVYLQKAICQNETSVFPVVNYDIFKHKISDSSAKFKNKPIKKLIEECSKNILNYISLPLSVVSSIHNKDPEESFVSKYNGGKSSRAYTAFNSRGASDFLAHPKDTLIRIGLNPDEYIIQKRRFSSKVTMDGIEILPFPVLIIKDKNHEKWAKRFMKEKGEHYIQKIREEFDTQFECSGKVVHLYVPEPPKPEDEVPF